MTKTLLLLISRRMLLKQKPFYLLLAPLLATVAILASCAHKPQATVPPQAPAKANNEASLRSGFASSVPGVKITNLHLIDKNKGAVYRSMRIVDEQDVQQLKEAIGLTDVIIFRHTDKIEDIESEEKMLIEQGIQKDRIVHIPFRWKDMPNFKEPCEQSIQALKLMVKARDQQGRSALLHCTVGEDRTGYITALYRMIYQGWSFEEAHQKEMCAKGYAEASPTKPEFVNKTIHQNISPVMAKMIYYVENKKLSASRLNADICDKDPLQTDAKFNRRYQELMGKMSCLKK